MFTIKKYIKLIILCACMCVFSWAYPQRTTYLIVKENTHTTILPNAKLIVKGNIEIEEDILGNGILSIIGDHNSQIDAKGNKINHLLIDNTSQINLISDLQIGIELQIKKGSFVLNDYNLYLDPFAKITSENGEIVINGSGVIIQHFLQPITNHSPSKILTNNLSCCISYLKKPEQTIPFTGFTHIKQMKPEVYIPPPSPPPQQTTC